MSWQFEHRNLWRSPPLEEPLHICMEVNLPALFGQHCPLPELFIGPFIRANIRLFFKKIFTKHIKFLKHLYSQNCDCLARPHEEDDRTRATVFKLKEYQFKQDRRKKKPLYESSGTETGCHERWWCLIPGGVHSHAGWGTEQPGLVEDASGHCRGAGTG